jgi:hypothetical protein
MRRKVQRECPQLFPGDVNLMLFITFRSVGMWNLSECTNLHVL